MKRCPVCKTQFENDANFCPMDAGKLEPIVEAPIPRPDLPTIQARIIGARFQLGPEIGGNRTGQVFSAQDGQSGNEVALKLIADRVLPTALIAQRTERELKQLMKVTSPRVVSVVDVGKQGDRLWVATEMVVGPTLAQVVGQGRLGVGRALRYAVEVGEALAEAAKVGVIHRDVSPKNVLVIDQTNVKVINFGIPTPVDVAKGRPAIMGLPEFLAPEQAEGKPVDQRSNIYSLGLLVWYMLVGEPPFSGSVDEVLKQQVQRAAPSLGSRGVAVSPELERTVGKALEKSSSRRHMTLRQLIGELEAAEKVVAAAAAVAPVAPVAPVLVQVPTTSPGAEAVGTGTVRGQGPAMIPSMPTPMPVPAPVPVPVRISAQVAVPAVRPSSQMPVPVAPFPPAPSLAVAVPASVPLAEARGPKPEALPKPEPIPAPTQVKRPTGVKSAAPSVTVSGQIAVQTPAGTMVGMPAEKGRASRQQAIIVPEPEPKLVISESLAHQASPLAQAAPKAVTDTSSTQRRPNIPTGGKNQNKGGTSVAGGKRGKRGKFRETLWFKQGEIDEATDRAAAAKAKAGASSNELPAGKAKDLPIEDRYDDDGSLSSDDHARLSLKTGSTQHMPASKQPILPGRAMAEDELIGEMKVGWLRYVLVGVGLAAALVAAYFGFFHH